MQNQKVKGEKNKQIPWFAGSWEVINGLQTYMLHIYCVPYRGDWR